MRSHVSVHRAATNFFSNSFVFKIKIEKEGLPRNRTPDLGAGGPEFKSRRPDHFMLLMPQVAQFFVFHHLEIIVFLLLPL
jgi:hypothetical protein